MAVAGTMLARSRVNVLPHMPPVQLVWVALHSVSLCWQWEAIAQDGKPLHKLIKMAK
jgi:hypothetical protein